MLHRGLIGKHSEFPRRVPKKSEELRFFFPAGYMYALSAKLQLQFDVLYPLIVCLARLFLLSSCRTGDGWIRTGDGSRLVGGACTPDLVCT